MKKVEIIGVTDLNGNPKEQRIWGSIRICPFDPEVGKCVYLTHTDSKISNATRQTTVVTNIEISDSIIKITTKNSIYILDVLNDE